MNKWIYIILVAVMVSCSGDDGTGPKPKEGGVRIIMGQNRYATRVIDADNLESEQVINNISVLFTDPSSDVIVYKYIDVGFRTSGDYRVVSIPLEPEDLQQKDIYVVTNYDDFTVLEALTTITELDAVKTPVISKSNNLEAGQGFCMYGMLADFDFTDPSLGSPIVNVERTCAKMRITLSFPGTPRLSTDNSFLIAKAASYTYVTENGGEALSAGDYFNFASERELVPSGTAFTANAYVYQADKVPALYIYTHINGSTEAQEFSTDLPLPDRNYLYDLDVRVYEELTATRSAFTTAGAYRLETTLTAYNGNGEIVRIENY